MSRIGRMPITIPSGVTVTIKDHTITVKGPKGQLTRTYHPDMTVTLEDNVLSVSRPSDDRTQRALHGLTRSLLANMVEGVTKGFEKNLEIVGVGYRAEKAGEKLVLRVGLSHILEVKPFPGVAFAIEGTNRIKITGVDKEAVGENAAEIRGLRLPDIYKGKGIRYAGEVVHLKPGKAGKVIGKK